MFKELIVLFRNKTLKFGYKLLVKPIFFMTDPEWIHDKALYTGDLLGKNCITRGITSTLFSYHNLMLEQKIAGIKFENPLGLAAGFDKNAQMIDITKTVGFTEIGSITGEKCEGNKKPRLWRLKKSKALVVYYGLKNDGSNAISTRLKNKKFALPVGISIAKTNSIKTTTLKPAIADYEKVYKKFENIGDYITVNLSCPNTYDNTYLFIDSNNLKLLLTKLLKNGKTKPLFLKISPDLTKKELDGIIKVALSFKIDGIICTNLTKNRKNKLIFDDNIVPKGGISGEPLKDLSTKTIKYVYKKTNGKLIIIGNGGISSAKDAYEKIRAGASLLQLITGMIFEGPQTISEINQGLVKLLKRDGFKNINEAVGIDIKK